MFADCLVEEGFRVWWDASLHSGETFDEVIERNLRDAKAVVVLWSPASVASRWVRAEATLADRRNKLVPAIIEPCDRPIIFELTHAAELSDWTGEMTDARWQNFVLDLRRLVDVEDEDAPAAAAQEIPRPASRQPLRPGANDIISAESRRSPPASLAARAAEPADDPLREVHCLEVDDGDLAGELIVVECSGAKIGRAPPANIVLPHKSISREHCILGIANDELLVTDLNSTNGTFVDGARVSRATILPVGSILRVGQVSMRHAVLPNGEVAKRAGAGGSEGPKAGRLAATF
jgi:hypothetical protein